MQILVAMSLHTVSARSFQDGRIHSLPSDRDYQNEKTFGILKLINYGCKLLPTVH